MFKKLTTTAMAVAALTCGGQAMAEHYVGGNISALNVDYSLPKDADLVALYGRLGTEFTENFSGEIRIGTGLDDDKLYGTKVELNYFYGAYVRGTIPVTDAFYPYAIVGFTRAELEYKVPGLSVNDSGSDVSFGVGTDIRLTANTDLNLEYMNYYDKNDISVDGFSVGFTYRFY
ncbi:porin family protein [Oceanisphaera ostreae]|uniref:Porin family protein n=1 Tax=Oceanisphaera ostreae TaxID=914151 RepID=A0ABW3KI26_9GAMM